MAATLGRVVPVGCTFGVLAFLRSLRGWGPGLGEGREGARESEVVAARLRRAIARSNRKYGVLGDRSRRHEVCFAYQPQSQFFGPNKEGLIQMPPVFSTKYGSSP